MVDNLLRFGPKIGRFSYDVTDENKNSPFYQNIPGIQLDEISSCTGMDTATRKYENMGLYVSRFVHVYHLLEYTVSTYTCPQVVLECGGVVVSACMVIMSFLARPWK